jgi:hypothetical protein
MGPVVTSVNTVCLLKLHVSQLDSDACLPYTPQCTCSLSPSFNDVKWRVLFDDTGEETRQFRCNIASYSLMKEDYLK